MLPLPHRAPADRLRDAREDHAICLTLAAFYRVELRRGDAAAREQHAWVIAHARKLRARFLGRLSAVAA